jgi:hypothetical protein
LEGNAAVAEEEMLLGRPEGVERAFSLTPEAEPRSFLPDVRTGSTVLASLLFDFRVLTLTAVSQSGCIVEGESTTFWGDTEPEGSTSISKALLELIPKSAVAMEPSGDAG